MAYVIEHGVGIFSSYFSAKLGRDLGAPGGGWTKCMEQATEFETADLAAAFIHERLPFEEPACRVILQATSLRPPAKAPGKLYEVLGISSSSSPAEVTAAYRRLAMEHHPDRGGDPAGERFKAIKAAYEALAAGS